MPGKLVITNGERSVRLPVTGGSAEINAFAQRVAPLYKKNWGTPVTVSYEANPDSPEGEEPDQDITFDLGNLPE